MWPNTFTPAPTPTPEAIGAPTNPTPTTPEAIGAALGAAFPGAFEREDVLIDHYPGQVVRTDSGNYAMVLEVDADTLTLTITDLAARTVAVGSVVAVGN